MQVYNAPRANERNEDRALKDYDATQFSVRYAPNESESAQAGSIPDLQSMSCRYPKDAPCNDLYS